MEISETPVQIVKEIPRRSPEVILEERAKKAAQDRERNIPKRTLTKLQNVAMATSMLFMMGGSYMQERSGLYLPMFLRGSDRQKGDAVLQLSSEVTEAMLLGAYTGMEVAKQEVQTPEQSNVTEEENSVNPYSKVLFEKIDMSDGWPISFIFENGKLVSIWKIDNFESARKDTSGLIDANSTNNFQLLQYHKLKERVFDSIDQKLFEDSMIIVYGDGLVIKDNKTGEFTSYVLDSSDTEQQGGLDLAYQNLSPDKASFLSDLYEGTQPNDKAIFIKRALEIGLNQADVEETRIYFNERISKIFFENDSERRDESIDKEVKKITNILVKTEIPLSTILRLFDEFDKLTGIFSYPGIEIGQNNEDRSLFMEKNFLEIGDLIEKISLNNPQILKETGGVEKVFENIVEIFNKVPEFFKYGGEFFIDIYEIYIISEDHKKALNTIFEQTTVNETIRDEMIIGFKQLIDGDFNPQTALYILLESAPILEIDPYGYNTYYFFIENNITSLADIKTVFTKWVTDFQQIKEFYFTNKNNDLIADPKLNELQLMHSYLSYYSSQVGSGREITGIYADEFEVLLSLASYDNIIFYLNNHSIDMAGIKSKEEIIDRLTADLNKMEWNSVDVDSFKTIKCQELTYRINEIHDWEIKNRGTDSLRMRMIDGLNPDALFMMISHGTFNATQGLVDLVDATYTSTFVALYNRFSSLQKAEIDTVLNKNSKDMPGFILAMGRYGVLAGEMEKRPQFYLPYIAQMLRNNQVGESYYLIADGLTKGLEGQSSVDYQKLIVDLYNQPDEMDQKKSFAAYIMMGSSDVFQSGDYREFYIKESGGWPKPEVVTMPELKERGKLSAVFYYSEGDYIKQEGNIEIHKTPEAVKYFRDQGYKTKSVDSRNWIITKKSGDEEISILVTYENQLKAAEIWKGLFKRDFNPAVAAFLQHSYKLDDFFSLPPVFDDSGTIYFIGSCGSAGRQLYLLKNGYHGQMIMERSTAMPGVSLIMLGNLINYRIKGGKYWEPYERKNSVTIDTYEMAMPTDFDMRVNKYISEFNGNR